MPRRQPLPRLWLMTDERLGEHLCDAIRRLPRGSGLVFRHYSLRGAARRALFARVRALARRRRLLLVVAGGEQLRADGRHNSGRGGGLRTASAHGLRELKRAERLGADLAFLSPVFPTRSHPDARPLGAVRFGLIARQSRIPLIALGGMDRGNARRLAALGAYGWAGIDAFSA